jgi:hypothetical protein
MADEFMTFIPSNQISRNVTAFVQWRGITPVRQFAFDILEPSLHLI